MSRAIKAGAGWRFWVDRGGTFTDVIGVSPGGRLFSRKLLSQSNSSDSDAVQVAIRSLFCADDDPTADTPVIEELRMGTTVATNALLERQGAATALLITRGFADALKIAYQNRPQLFARHIQLPDPLYEAVIECDERLAADGSVVLPLDEKQLEESLENVLHKGIESLAIVFMHAYAHPCHEQQAAALARRLGFRNVSVSHELNPIIKLIGRGDTSVIDAYLNPVLRDYVDDISAQLEATARVASLLFMQSNGGLTEAATFCGKDSVLSGPAGGVVGMVESAAAEGFDRVIGFDMGGTSTDVSVYSGRYERNEETEIAGARLRASMLKIHTVAAGGGSVLHFSEGRLQAGPRSAGAHPGPAAYGLGGPLTVTDCNVLLGRLQADFFPRILGPSGDAGLQIEAVRRAFAALGEQLVGAGYDTTPEKLALVFQQIAVQRMAGAIKQICLAGGHDASEYVLACFGGAGPQHACQVADELGIKKVLVHPLAGLLSALGIGLAPITAVREKTVRRPLSVANISELARDAREVELAARHELAANPRLRAAAQVETSVKLRYQATDTSLPVPMSDPETMSAEFAQAHLARFGFSHPDRQLVIESVIAVATLRARAVPELPVPQAADDGTQPEALDTRPVFFHDSRQATAFFHRDSLRPGMSINGPAIVLDEGATTVIEPGWRARVTPRNQLLLTRVRQRPAVRENDTRADPARLEVFNNLFMHVAEQMGVVLQNTARSVNIKERLDFSCAVFDPQGQLVANAPHMPVHLGSMGESVTAIIADNAQMQDGDVFMLNDPYRGGTHLPDITVVAPVFVPGHQQADFFVAARGHHADIGGISPGSMPPHSRSINEEGVLFRNFRLVAAGLFNEEQLRSELCAGSWPARDPEQNIADLKAQVAACAQGRRLLLASMEKYGPHLVRAYLGHVQDNAENAVREVLARLDDGEFEYPLDNGLVVRVAVQVDRKARVATIDFAGSSRQHSGNFNAPFSVCRAAVLYVFRCLVDADIPLNAGCLKPIHINAPAGSMLNPEPPAAVVAGNVETSQAITNALFGALGAMAASQGTMNNFTFGNADRQYYETVAGGSGAGPGFPGADAVQTHMTNSRLTDPEVLELRYPVRLREFAVRRGSGGAGEFAGGNGVRREIEFLADMQAAILSGHRRIAPFGLAGGEPGQCGRNTWIPRNQEPKVLTGTAQIEVTAGDRMLIETPGGGGYGTAPSAD